MATPIINTNLGKVVTATDNIADDLSTLRPLLRNMIFNAFPTDKVENAPIASFPDGADNVPVKSATFAITPVQDLHGYDSPWPAGGGKNLMGLQTSPDAAISYAGCVADSGANDNRVQLTGSAQTYSCMRLYYVLPAGTYTLSIKGTTSDSFTPNVSIYDKATTPFTFIGQATPTSPKTFTLTGETHLDFRFFTSDDTATARTVTYYDVQLELGSSATSFAPYSNECPITGFTGAEITDRGVNLWDEEWEVGDINGTTGQNESSSSNIRSKNYIQVKPNTSFCFYAPNQIKIRYYDQSKTYISGGVISNNAVIAMPNNAYYIRFSMPNAYGTTYNHDISINYPSTDTAYHASVGTTHDITWQDEAGTVYGGTLAYLGGDAWRLTKTMESVDMGALIWQNYGGRNGEFYSNFSNVRQGTNNILCAIYKTVASSTDTAFFDNPSNEYCINTYIGGNGLRAYDTTYTDAQTFKTAMSGVQLVYELATPVTYDLTGEELATVLGTNNVFSNTGDVTELGYRADTAKYIEKKLAE